LTLRLKDLHQTWLGIGYAILFAFGISNALEKFAGQPRPDLIARCQVDTQVYLNETIMLFGAGVVDSSVCRQTDAFILNEGFASFPSGHSSGKSFRVLNCCKANFLTFSIMLSGLRRSDIPLPLPCASTVYPQASSPHLPDPHPGHVYQEQHAKKHVALPTAYSILTTGDRDIRFSDPRSG